MIPISFCGSNWYNKEHDRRTMIPLCIFFRAINVGKGRKVPMERLKEVLAVCGLIHITSYIQSGNIVCISPKATTEKFKQLLEKSFEEEFGFHSEVFMKTQSEIAHILQNNPFISEAKKDPGHVIIMLFQQTLAQKRITYVGPEKFFLIEHEMYIYYPHGIGRSKLTGSYIEKKLGSLGTARNIKTIMHLEKMLSGITEP